jgi:hypothetical protein
MHNVERLIRKSRSREAETVRFDKGARRPKIPPYLRLKRLRSNPGKPTSASGAETFLGATRMGTRCRCGGGREALTSHNGQGCKHTQLAARNAARRPLEAQHSRLASRLGDPRGFIRMAWEIGEGRGKCHSSPGPRKSPLVTGVGQRGAGAWGRQVGAQGA